MALGQKDEAMQAVEVQGRELEHKIEQAEALRAVIRRLQGSSSRASLLYMHLFGYSSNILIANFDPMDSILASGTWKNLFLYSFTTKTELQHVSAAVTSFVMWTTCQQ